MRSRMAEDSCVHACPTDKSSATRPTGRYDCNPDAQAGLDVMMG